MDIPRKLSIDDVFATGEHSDIWDKIDCLLDGYLMRQCVSYDMDAGEVTVYAVDEAGRLIIEGDGMKRVTATGKVEVRPQSVRINASTN